MNQGAQFALTLLQYMPTALAGVQAAVEMLEWGRHRLEEMVEEDRYPTAEEWRELNERVAALREPLHSDER